MKRLLSLALLVFLLLPACRGPKKSSSPSSATSSAPSSAAASVTVSSSAAAARDSMPQQVAYVSFTVEDATHWLGARNFAATGARSQAAPASYHMVMKDDVWYLEESSVRPAAGQFYYNDYGRISAAQAQGILSAVQGVVTRTRGSAEPSAAPGSKGRKRFTLAVNANDGDRARVLYYESDKVKDKAFRQLLQAMRNVGEAEGSVLPLNAQLSEETPVK